MFVMRMNSTPKNIPPFNKIVPVILVITTLLPTLIILILKQDHFKPLNISPSEVKKDSIKSTERELFVWDEVYKDWCIARGDEQIPEFIEESLHVWPDTTLQQDDRIINQLKLSQQSEKIFQIYSSDYFLPKGQKLFLDDKCRVTKCEVTDDIEKADALIFQNSDVPKEPKIRKPEQVWIAYLLESPPNTFDKRFARKYRGKHEFNWTATYRRDSDIVAPYSKFVPYCDSIKLYLDLNRSKSQDLDEFERHYVRNASKHHKDLIENKVAKVAWMASNCNAANSRLEYAIELSKYIQVDIFGRCGNMTCDKRNNAECLDLLNKKYKFYLSFENSNCQDYITEKLYQNAYGHNDVDHLILPIVMGASRTDYEQLAPLGSFLHINDFVSPKALAEYLLELDHNYALYYSYFRWKALGKFIDTKFMCRVCAMLHYSRTYEITKSYKNIMDWWSSKSCKP